MEVVALESLFVDGSQTNLRPEARAAIARADVIIGVDTVSQNAFTLFGTPAFEESVQLGRQVALRTLRVALDEQSGELERLAAVVRAIKRVPAGE